MKATIDQNGDLTIIPNNDLESFALQQWEKQAGQLPKKLVLQFYVEKTKKKSKGKKNNEN